MSKQHDRYDLLEANIVSALKSERSSTEFGDLINKVEDTIVQAEAEAREAETRAADIEASPDAASAFSAAARIRQRYERLVAVLPRLKACLAEAQAAEYRAKWEPRYQEIKAERDAFQAEFTNKVDSAINLLVELIARAKVVNEKIAQVNGTAPASDHRRLEPIHLRFANGLRLVDLDGRQLWPNPRHGVEAAMLVAGSVPQYDGREWWELNEERQRQHQTANEEMARYYAEQTCLQEERQNRELNERR